MTNHREAHLRNDSDLLSRNAVFFAKFTSASVVLSSSFAAALLLIMFAGCEKKTVPESPLVDVPATKLRDDPPETTLTAGERRTQTISQAEALVEKQQYSAAIAKLRELLLLDPDDVEVLFRLASVTASAGDLSEAVLLLDSIPDDDPNAGVPALGQSADWCFQLKRYGLRQQWLTA